MDKKIKIFSGIAASLAFGAFILYIRDKQKPTKRKLYDAIRDILEQIDAIVDEYPEDQRAANISKDKETFIKFIQEAGEEFFDIASIDQELKQIPQFLMKHEYQLQLFNFEYVSFYLRKQSLETLNYVVQSIVKKAQLESQQYDLSENAKLFKDFIFVYLNVVFEELEVIIPDESKKNKLILINVMANGFFIYLQSILKNAPSLRGLLAEALLTPVNYKYGHDCSDAFHQKPVTEPQSIDCQCCLFDIMTRYCSVFTPTLQKLIVAILVEYQVFNTYEHLVQVGNILMKNAFYLNSQISFNSMYYVAEASPFTTLLIFALSHQKVRVKICYSGNSLETQLLYLERVINQNNPQFLTKLQPSFIHLHSSLYSIFADPVCLQTLFRDEKRAFALIIHFLGILLILETRDTVLIDQVQDFNLIDWLSQNVGPLMAQETIGFLQLQFITSLLRNAPQEQVRDSFFKAYLQCLRVTQNSRIKKRLEQIKQLDICTGLTKIFSPILLTQLQFNPSRKDIKKMLGILPFQDKAELQNIFTNISRILIDLPTMNLYFLKFLGPKCKEISQDSEVVCRGYQAHVISALTLSFDTHMVTLQLGVLFGQLEQLLSDLTTRCQRDLGNYENLKNFLKRDIVLMLDLMENPYYYYNILAYLKTNTPEFRQFEKCLLQRAAISIIRLNGPITITSLLDTLGSFVYLQDVPDCIKQILDPAPDQKFNILPQYADNYPYMVLQRDYESAEMFLENVKGDQFDEMIYSPDNIQFLKDIRRRFFKSQNFLNFIDSLVKFSESNELEIWTTKFLYYGKQTLLSLKKPNKNLEDLFQSDSVKQFIPRIKSEKLIKYLSA